MYICLHIKLSVISVRLLRNFEFSKNTQTSNFMEISPVRMDRRTDVTKVIISFYSFVKPRKHTWNDTPQ